MKRRPMPFPMGRKGKPLDWRPYRDACMACLGHIPEQRLTLAELDALGFVAAADHVKKAGRYG